jgi:hypothetical protein
VKITYEPQFEVTVNGEQWKRVANLDDSGPNDEVYTTRQQDEGESSVIFGNGQQGRRLPTGSVIRVAYRYGAGTEGSVGETIALTWTSGGFRKNGAIEAVIEPLVDGIKFRVCRKSQITYRWKWIAMLCRKLKRCH